MTRAATLPILLVLASCAGQSAEPKPEPKTRGWVDCYEDFRPRGSAYTDLRRLTRACGPIAGMRAITPIERGRQSAEDPADVYTFYVPEPRCYRVYAVGDRGVEDLDLLLRGPDGAEVVADLSDDAAPILPPTGPICFDTPGLYALEISVFRGSGGYAVQVWGS